MSERPKEHDWKSCVPRKGTEGSNPSLCAKIKKQPFFGVFLIKTAVFYYKVFCVLLGFGVFCY